MRVVRPIVGVERCREEIEGHAARLRDPNVVSPFPPVQPLLECKCCKAAFSVARRLGGLLISRHSMKRPLLPVALFYVGGILMARFISLPPLLLLACSLALAALTMAWLRARLVGLCTLIVLAGWTNQTLRTAILSPHDLRRILGEHPEIVTLRGTVRETPVQRVYERNQQESWRTMVRIDVTALRLNRQAWQPAAGRMAVTTQGILSTNFFAGQEVEITGVAGRPKIAAADGTFDYRAYLNQLGIYYQLQAASGQDWRIVSSPSRPPLADWFREWARQALALGFPVEDESLRLELAIIFGIFFCLFRALRLPRAVCGLVLIPLIWFYAALTGWPASAIRATVMLTIIILGWVLKRPSDLINSLFAAALAILIWQPQQLFQAGFQLSFFVVLCIIVTLPPLDEFVQRLFTPDPLLPDELRPRWQKILRLPVRDVLDILLVSFTAWIGSIPLVAYYFHIVTPVSAPANLLAVPLCALVLVSNLAGLLLAGWFPAAAELFNHSGWFLMECIRVTSRWFANLPGAFAYVPAPSLGTFAVYYGLLIGTFSGWLFSPKRRKWSMVVVVLIGIFYFARWQNSRAETQLTVLPLNGGHGIFVDASGRKNDWLIDCGNDNAVEFVVKHDRG